MIGIGCLTGQAELLLRYDFTGGSPAPVPLADRVTGSDAAWVGLAGGFSSLYDDAWVSLAETPGWEDRARYLQITVSAVEGSLLNLQSLTFELGGTRGSAGGELEVFGQVRTDADLYATHLRLTPGPGWTAGHAFSAGTPTYTRHTADLSHPIYQGRQSLTFRFHPKDAVSLQSAFFRLDTLEVRGEVVTAGLRLREHDICVYGGTSGGVAAAVQAARMGKRVALLATGLHLGGMSSGGLGMTDKGKVATIGGLSREFYVRVGGQYGSGIRYEFEPSVAESVFNEMLNEAGVDVFYGQRLAAVSMNGNRIRQITMDNGEVHRAAMYIDTSYEGDLMAMAGVSYTVGREANSTYGETYNGVRLGSGPSGTQIDPYVIPGDPSSGLIPNVQPHTPGPEGSADGLTQAYNFRMCLTQAANRLPIDPPAGYDPFDYELLARFIALRTPPLTLVNFMTLSMVGNGKTDTNNRGGAISTDLPAASWPYPDADHLTRAAIWHQHEDFMRGFFHFLATDSRMPAGVRLEMQSWGLAADEFKDNNGWPHQLYVREARRMVSDYVMTQGNSQGSRVPADSIAMASYPNDSHTVARVVVNGVVRVDGGLYVAVDPYPISYRSIVPRVGECANLLVTFALSASHVAFGSLRMEPVFMMTSHSAAAAACLAIDDGVDIQQVDYPRLAAQLLADGQVLTGSAHDPYTVENSDTNRVEVVGSWSVGASAGYSGVNYVHDQNTDKGDKSFSFVPDLPTAGRYELAMWWVAHSNRASNVPVDILHAGGTTTVTVNQRNQGSQWVALGAYDFQAGTAGSVRVRTTGTNGYVIADAVRFFPEGSPGVVVQLWASDGRAAEPAGPAGVADRGAFRLYRTGGSVAAPLEVAVELGGTAVHGVDYVLEPGTWTIPAGVRSLSVSVIPLPDDQVEGEETVTLRLQERTGHYDIGELRQATVTIADAPYQAWLRSHFSVAELADPAVSGPLADPDGDGLSNREEAFAGTDPRSAERTAQAIPQVRWVSTGGGSHLALEFTRAKAAGLPYVAEVASGLQDSTWLRGADHLEETLLEDDGTTQRLRIRDRTALESTDQRFLRLHLPD